MFGILGRLVLLTSARLQGFGHMGALQGAAGFGRQAAISTKREIIRALVQRIEIGPCCTPRAVRLTATAFLPRLPK
jgi:hypothetical protein